MKRISIPFELIQDDRLCDKEKIVFGYLLDNREKSNEELAEFFKITTKSVSRIISNLKRKGYITAEYGKYNKRTIYINKRFEGEQK